MKSKIFSIIFIGIVVLSGVLLILETPPKTEPPTPADSSSALPSQQTAATPSESLFVTLKDGSLAVYTDENRSRLLQLIDIDLNALPAEEVESLKKGFTVENRTQLNYLLEDYTS